MTYQMATPRTFLVRSGLSQLHYTERYQEKTPGRQLFYLALHLLPGPLAYGLINIPAGVAATHLPSALLQGLYIVTITLGWHLIVPFSVLRWGIICLFVNRFHSSLSIDGTPWASWSSFLSSLPRIL